MHSTTPLSWPKRLSRYRRFAILLIIGIASMLLRLLLDSSFSKSGLVYIGVPYLIALCLSLLKPISTQTLWWHEFRDFTLISLIVFLGSSIVLYEGFLCMLFFMPIYFLIVSLVFLAKWAKIRWQKRQAKHLATALPLLICVFALEGSHPALSLPRAVTIEVNQVVPLDPDQIRSNLTHLSQPGVLDQPRGWLLSIFPMPYAIEADSFSEGALHTLHLRYHRWFVTNTHEGTLKLRVERSTDTFISMRIVEDTTYLANYLRAEGGDLTLTPIDANRTHVTLKLRYERSLDPAWYFDPVQKIAAKQMAELFIDRVVASTLNSPVEA